MSKHTFSRDQYLGHDNQEIKDLLNEFYNLEAQKLSIKLKIAEIRDNCEHDFKLVCTGVYEDYYQCSKCGEEAEK